LIFVVFCSVFALCGELSRRLDLNAQRALTLNVYNNNYQVFEHKPMVVSDDSDQVNMLVREREVGNVFRMFRNPDDYDASPAPTAVKVLDHDKQRWATLTLGEVLSRTGVWTGETNDVTKFGASGFDTQDTPHLTNYRENPLRYCKIVGDLPKDKLTDSTIRAAVNSIRRILFGRNGVMPENDSDKVDKLTFKLATLCRNNIWGDSAASIANLKSNTPVTAPIGASTETGTSVATASVEDVAEALQRSIVDTVSDDPESVESKAMSSAIMASINEVVSATSNMTDTQRGSIAAAFVGAAPNFKASRSALKKLLRNTDDSKAADLEASYSESVKKDFKSNWKSINTEAKIIASKIGPTSDGKRLDKKEKMKGFQLHSTLIRTEAMSFSPLERIIARWYLGCSIDLPTIVSLDNQGIVTPFGAYVFRPFQSFQMGSAVVM
jgi:hypothetical protein